MKPAIALTLIPSVLVLAAGCAGAPKADTAEKHGAAPAHAAHAPAVSADEAWRRLEEGNQRFASGHGRAVADYSARRAELAKGQQPFAVIVSCSDSRVGPEIVFDQGLGDLFVIRTAGDVVDDEALGSIEYAVEHLGSPLIVVLGHSSCGAVTAAVEGGSPPGHIGAVTRAIRPAVERTRGQPGDKVDNAVRQNVRDVVRQLTDDKPILWEYVHEGKLKIVGARYDLATGRVERLAE
jgi:carbonic anhydrase